MGKSVVNNTKYCMKYLKFVNHQPLLMVSTSCVLMQGIKRNTKSKLQTPQLHKIAMVTTTQSSLHKNQLFLNTSSFQSRLFTLAAPRRPTAVSASTKLKKRSRSRTAEPKPSRTKGRQRSTCRHTNAAPQADALTRFQHQGPRTLEPE